MDKRKACDLKRLLLCSAEFVKSDAIFPFVQTSSPFGPYFSFRITFNVQGTLGRFLRAYFFDEGPLAQAETHTTRPAVV
jgi:hypothetical protein